MEASPNTDTAQLFESARLRKADVDAAFVKWRADRAAILKGVLDEAGEDGTSPSAGAARRLQVKYNNLRRLQSEYEQLKAEHDAPDPDRRVFYALDPHVLTIYADAWNSSILTGFDFLANEWSPGEVGNDDRRWYMLYLMSAIFQSQKIGLTGPAREAILQTLTFFTERQDRSNRNIADRIQVYEDLLERLSQTPTGDADDAQKLELHFKHLTAASTFRPAYPDVQIARMNQVLKAGSFLNIRSLLLQSDIEDEKRKAAVRLFDDAMQSGESIVECQVRLDRSFRVFLESTEIPDDPSEWSDMLAQLSVAQRQSERRDLTKEPSYREFKHRNTEHLQRRAILELHIANLCLEAVGANAEIRYLTFSVRLFDFVSSLSRSLRVPLVHPRFLFAHKDSDFFAQISEGMDGILAVFSGALEVIERDRRVTAREVARIEDFNRHLQPLRDTNAFAAVHDGSFTIAKIMEGVVESVVRLEQAAKEASPESDRASDISKKVRTKVDEIRDLLESGSSESAKIFTHYSQAAIEGDIYRLFRGLTDEIEVKNQPKVLARLVHDQSGKPLRMICLPITGAYRYMFSITNTDVIENKEIGSLVTTELQGFELERFTNMLEKAVSDEGAADTHKNRAMFHFVRSFHAASYRDWSLADLLAKRGIDEINKVQTKKRSARFFLLKHELLFLRHLAARGLAERQTTGKSHVRALISAMSLLQGSVDCIESAHLCEDGPENFSGEGPFLGAMTFRVALAFAASILEVLIAQREAVARGQAELEFEDISVFGSASQVVAEKKFAWQTAGFTNISPKLVWSYPRQAVEGLSTGLLRLAEEMAQSIDVNGVEKGNSEFDQLLWQYRLLRCEQVIHFLALLVEREHIFGRVDEALTEHIHSSDFCELSSSFRFDVDRIGCFESPLNDDLTPFAGVICGYYSWKKVLGDETLGAFADRVHVFEDVRKAGSHLDPLGLPRRVSNEILSDWSKVLLDDFAWGTEFVEAFVPE